MMMSMRAQTSLKAKVDLLNASKGSIACRFVFYLHGRQSVGRILDCPARS
jgi:hypothetical protein